MSKSSFSCLISLLLIFILVVPGFGQTRVGKLGVGVDGSMQYVFGAGNVNTIAGNWLRIKHELFYFGRS